MNKQIQKNLMRNNLFKIICTVNIIFIFSILIILLITLILQGYPQFSMNFIFNFPSRIPEKAGIYAAWVGSLLIMLVTLCVAAPIGIGAGIYLEEYAKKNRFNAIIEIAINNLAGIPSIIYGLLALGLMVYTFNLGNSIQTAGLTLGLLVLPIVIVATRESIRQIPPTLREAAFALGAAKWQVIFYHTLPYSLGGILTGVILAISRAIGETAPLLTIGALTYIAFLPSAPLRPDFPYISFDWLEDPFTVLPIQMFNWVSRPQEAFHVNAAATGIFLIIMNFFLNLTAIIVRNRMRKKIHW